MSSAPQILHQEVTQRVAYLTLNRPEAQNALNVALVKELKEALRTAETDPRVKVIVIAGDGDTFSKGIDTAHMQEVLPGTLEEQLVDMAHLAELFQLIFRLKKPVIAQVHGTISSHGCTLAASCDFVFAAAGSSFQYADVKWGFLPALAVAFLPKRMPLGAVRRFLLTGQAMTSKEALQVGLADFVFPPEELAEEVRTFAQTLCTQNSPGTMELLKKMLADVPEIPEKDCLGFVCRIAAHSRKTVEFEIGVRALQNKQDIDW